MADDLNTQIWKEDIDRWTEDTLSMWKTQYRLWERAKYQGAPSALLGELSAICQLYKDAHDKMKALSVYFPPEERTARR